MSYINSSTVKERNSFKFHCIVFEKIIGMQILFLKSAVVFIGWKKKMNTSHKWRLFGTKSDIFTQPKVYNAKKKSLMCQNGLFTICLSLVHDVLDRSKSSSTYCWSHLLKNSGTFVHESNGWWILAELLIIFSVLTLTEFREILFHSFESVY